MKKEVLFAIAAGSVLGLLLAFTLWRGGQSTQKNNSQNTPKPTITTSKTPDEIVDLSVTHPKNSSVSDSELIEVSGKTTPNSYVIISTTNNDYILRAKPDNSFNKEIKLNNATDEINITSFDSSGNPQKQNLLVAFYKDTKSTTSFQGTVTDITESSIQIRSEIEGIRQISTTSDTIYENLVTNDDIEFADIAIGDSITALGSVNGKEILTAQEILITEPLELNSKVIIYGQITEKKSREITIKDLNGPKKYTFSTSSSTTVTTDNKDGESEKSSYSKLIEDSIVIVIGVTDDNTFIARRIHLPI